MQVECTSLKIVVAILCHGIILLPEADHQLAAISWTRALKSSWSTNHFIRCGRPRFPVDMVASDTAFSLSHIFAHKHTAASQYHDISCKYRLCIKWNNFMASLDCKVYITSISKCLACSILQDLWNLVRETKVRLQYSICRCLEISWISRDFSDFYRFHIDFYIRFTGFHLGCWLLGTMCVYTMLHMTNKSP